MNSHLVTIGRWSSCRSFSTSSSSLLRRRNSQSQPQQQQQQRQQFSSLSTSINYCSFRPPKTRKRTLRPCKTTNSTTTTSTTTCSIQRRNLSSTSVTTIRYKNKNESSLPLPTHFLQNEIISSSAHSSSFSTATATATTRGNDDMYKAHKQQQTLFDPNQTYLLRISTYSRGPRGKSGAGLVLYNDTSATQEIWSGGLYYSYHPQSYNWLETAYAALIEILEPLRQHGIRRIQLQCSSPILVRQIQGQYSVVSKRLRKIYWRTMNYIEVGFDHVVPMNFIPMEQNLRADELAKQVVGMRQSTEYVQSNIQSKTTQQQPQQYVYSRPHSTTYGQLPEQPKKFPAESNDHNIQYNDTILNQHASMKEDTPSCMLPIQLSKQESLRSKIDPTKTYLLRIDGGLRRSTLGGVGMVLYENDNYNDSKKRKRRRRKNKQELWCGWKPIYFDVYDEQQQQEEYDSIVFHNHLYEPDANVCEYKALLLGMKYMTSIGVRKLCVESDSLLMVKQIQRGRAASQIKNFKLKLLHGAVMEQLQMFDYVDMKHIKRYRNKRADGLVRQAMDTLSSHGFL